jgi:hypothetical protein
MPRRMTNTTTAGAVALSALLMVACSSGTTKASSSTSSVASATTAAPSPSATGSLPPCPSASVVNAALGQSDTGPVVSGTPQFKICTYKGSSPVSTKVTISVNTPTGFKADEKNVAKGFTLATVPGLGDDNYGLSGVGEVFVLKGNTQVEILAPGTTDAQDDALVNQIF